VIAPESLPTDLAAAHALILAERAARLQAEALLARAQAEAATAKAEVVNAQADLSSTEALIGHLKLEIEKLRRQLYGSRSERKARLLDQMELQLEELEGNPPVKAAGQGRLVRFLVEVRDHVLASVATCAASPSASSASGSKSSPIHSVNSAWRSCFGSLMASRNSA
jgi:septal ring factor EnvC (AmiA/AmiB activator)